MQVVKPVRMAGLRVHGSGKRPHGVHLGRRTACNAHDVCVAEVKMAWNLTLRMVSTKTVDNSVQNLRNTRNSVGLEVDWVILSQSCLLIFNHINQLIREKN